MPASFEIVPTGIRTASVEGFTHVIKRVEWVLKGTQDGQTFELPQTTEMGPVDAQAFIPLEEITDPAIVIAWVEAAHLTMTAVKDHIQLVLDRLVAEAATEKVPMPWAPQPEAP